MQKSEKSLKEAAQKFVSENGGINAKRRAQELAQWLKPWLKDVDTVLEYGCGAGYLLRELPVRNKKGVWIEGRPPSHTVSSDVVSSLDEVEEKWASLIVVTGLDRCVNPFLVLQQLFRKLKHGGRIIVEVPCYSENNLASLTSLNSMSSGSLYSWDAPAIGQLVRMAGFEVSACSVVRSSSWINPLRHLSAKVFGGAISRREATVRVIATRAPHFTVQGINSAAGELAKESVKRVQDLIGQENVQLAQTLENFAEVELDPGPWNALPGYNIGERLYIRAVLIREKDIYRRTLEVANGLKAIAAIYRETERDEEAAILETRAADLLARPAPTKIDSKRDVRIKARKVN